jgi:hypothetical protein
MAIRRALHLVQDQLTSTPPLLYGFASTSDQRWLDSILEVSLSLVISEGFRIRHCCSFSVPFSISNSLR